MENKFKVVDGRKIWECGEVSIEGVKHLVLGGFIKCNSSLNSKPWNTTEPKENCNQCFEQIKEYKQNENKVEYTQLTLF